MGFAARKQELHEAAAKVKSVSGRRHRRRSREKGARGHYQLGFWSKRSGIVIPLPKCNPETAQLIKTTVYNPRTQSSTLLFIPFDLDIDNVYLNPQFVEHGAISWRLVSAYLQDREPALFNSITYATQSSGGRGLALAISVSPFLLNEENARIQHRARHLQTILIRILNSHGLGADEGASGLDRWMPNFKNTKRLVYQNEIRRKYVENARHFVIRELYEAFRAHPAVAYRRKTERPDEFLHPDWRVEQKLAHLAVYLERELKGCAGVCTLSAAEICQITGMQRSTFYRSVLQRENLAMTWLRLEKLGGRKGYQLTYMPSYQLIVRAEQILAGEGVRDSQQLSRAPANQCMPQDVADGYRNSWLWKTAVQMKHALVPYSEASAALCLLASRIPGYGYGDSWSLGHPQSICRSIYKTAKAECSPILQCLPAHIEGALGEVRRAIAADAKNLDVGSVRSTVPCPSLRATLPLELVASSDAFSGSGAGADPAHAHVQARVDLILESVFDPQVLSCALEETAKGKGLERLTRFWNEQGEVIRSAASGGWYQPDDVRRFKKPKPGGGYRTISLIPAHDKMLQRAVASILVPHFETMFSQWSFAYRKGFGAKRAIAAARGKCKALPWVLSIDIAKYFDTVHHGRLMEILGETIEDHALLNFIDAILSSWGHVGILQGAPLSNLLSNVYLHQLDEWLTGKGISFCRFADDIRVFASSESEAQDRLVEITQYLTAKLYLALNDSKTNIVNLKQMGIVFLGEVVSNEQG